MTTPTFDRVPEPLRAALQRRGYTEPTAVQSAALEALAEPRDLQLSSQTGSGKTVALGLVVAPPLLDPAAGAARGPLVLVVVPTRELAAQVRSELHWLYADVPGASVACVTGGTPVGPERRTLRRGPRVLVGTPGRLLDHLRSGALSLADVGHLVLDEADQMLDMGFREELEAILEETPAERRTHLVSATFPAGILRLAERYQRAPLSIQGTPRGEANADIEHRVYRVPARDRYAALVNLLIAEGGERTLLFVSTRAETAELADRLTRDGFSALPLSGELPQAQRTRTLAAFRSGAVPVLVATDVASRGLDVPEVETVVHGSPCTDSEVYTHRSGRTGRAGRKGKSLLLVAGSEERRARRILHDLRIDAEWAYAPNAAEVRQVQAERARQATREALAAAPCPDEAQLAEARALLEGRDPAEVVGALLAGTRTASGPRPQELGPRSKEPARTLEPRPRREKVRPSPAGGAEDGYTRFFINWGAAKGATPKRILAHVCRRGGIPGRAVGAIRMQPKGSTFDVARGFAREFENRASRPDERDPHLVIRRAWEGPPQHRKLARA